MGRAKHELAAAAFVETNAGPLGALVMRVSDDLAGELHGMTRPESDARIAAEVAYRIDAAIAWDEVIDGFPGMLIEAVDYFVAFLAALGAVALVRRLQRRGLRLSALAERMEDEGERWGKARRRRVERRIRALG